MPVLLVFGARNLGRTLASVFSADGWSIAAVAASEETIDAFRSALPGASSHARSKRSPASWRRSCSTSPASAHTPPPSSSSPGHTTDASAPKPPSHGSPQQHRSRPPPDKRSATASTDQATGKLNRALHMILVTRRRIHPPTIAYIDRRLQEGKTRREANRCLKRYLARNLYRPLEHGPPPAT